MKPEQTTLLLAGIGLIALAAFAAGWLARRVGQPAVVGEVLVGIAAGPTLLHGAVGDALLPHAVRPLLSGFSDFGIVVFMFVVGLELERRLLRDGKAAISKISIGSMVVPAVLGTVLGAYFASQQHVVGATGFVLFMASAMSVTAFPVLARILRDERADKSATGQMALTCAAVNDVVAWLLLAAAVATTGSSTHDSWRLLLLVPYFAAMVCVVRPLLDRLVHVNMFGEENGRGGTLGVLLGGVLLSAAATSWIGLHAIFGAFLFGLIMPRGASGAIRDKLAGSVADFARSVLVPIFFVLVGLKVDLTALSGGDLVDLALILLVAVGGKFGGTYVFARWSKIPARESVALGVLMNTRGLTELVVLSVGLQLGLLRGATYSSMVAMALITTAMTGPLLRVTLAGPSSFGKRKRPRGQLGGFEQAGGHPVLADREGVS